ncbi:MAG: hypothetical protein RIS21_87, partial [Planctomycetota bacterium]
MGMTPSEITSILKQQIKAFDGSVAVSNFGTVLSVGDGVA